MRDDGPIKGVNSRRKYILTGKLRSNLEPTPTLCSIEGDSTCELWDPCDRKHKRKGKPWLKYLEYCLGRKLNQKIEANRTFKIEM